MAKLVEILAKELGEWPVDCCLTICQDTSGDIGAWRTLTPEVTCPDDDDVVWSSMGHIMNITPLSCIADDHATAIVTREMWQAERDRAVTGQGVSGSGPVQWRDRIREIDTTFEAMTAERAELVSKLAGEGFALIAVAAEPVEDMGDWRNWKVGDILEVVSNTVSHEFNIGEIVRYKKEFGSIGCGGKCELLDCSDWWVMDQCDLKFHSRPTA